MTDSLTAVLAMAGRPNLLDPRVGGRHAVRGVQRERREARANASPPQLRQHW